MAPFDPTWTGFYVGGNVGYSWGNADVNYSEPIFSTIVGPPAATIPLPSSFSGSEKLDGLIGGGQIGYDWQVNAKWIVGLEADFQDSAEKGNYAFGALYCPSEFCVTNGAINGNISTAIDWFGTVRGRLGALVSPSVWIYGTGGLAYGRIAVAGSVSDNGTGFLTAPATWAFGQTVTKVGWTVGGGLEGFILNSRNWTWRVEYLYIDFGTISGTGVDTDPSFGGTFTYSTKVTDNILRLGLNYKF
jgi:outer membrane immunogenic protein